MSTLKTNKISKNLGSNLVIGDGGSDTLSVNATPTFTKLASFSANVGIGTTTPGETLEVVHATAPAIQLNRTNDGGFKSILRQQGNDFEIRGSSGSTKIYTGAADGDSSTSAFQIDASGHITKPLQPSVNGQLTSATLNVTGDATTYYLNNESNSLAHTEIKDVNGDFLNGTFTAPVTGTYLLNGILQFSGIHGTGHNSGIHYIHTSNRIYQRLFNPYYDTNVHTNGGLNLTVIADMDASDVAYQSLYIAATNKTIDLDTASTFFQAFLLG